MNEVDLPLDAFNATWISDDMRSKTELAFQRADKLTMRFPSLILENESGFETIRTGVFRVSEVKEELINRYDKSNQSCKCE
jgi:protein-disulfide isomerase-like protein with CxxC motif